MTPPRLIPQLESFRITAIQGSDNGERVVGTTLIAIDRTYLEMHVTVQQATDLGRAFLAAAEDCFRNQEPTPPDRDRMN